jgi:predicted membrane protein
MNQMLIGALFGGSLISSLGALSTYSIEKKKPTMKSVMRDFIIGSILFLLIMQLLPESSESVIKYLTTLFIFNKDFISNITEGGDLEIEVGLRKF